MATGKKPKTYVNWVAIDESLTCEVRLYDKLFTHEYPAKVDNIMEHINPNALIVMKGAKMNKNLLKDLKMLDKY